MFIMPETCPEEFRRSYRKDEAPITQIAKDVGLSLASLQCWIKNADGGRGREGAGSQQSRPACGTVRGIHLPAFANLARDIHPKRKCAGCSVSWRPGGLPVHGPLAVSCRVLSFSRRTYQQKSASLTRARDWDDAPLINADIDFHH